MAGTLTQGSTQAPALGLSQCLDKNGTRLLSSLPPQIEELGYKFRSRQAAKVLDPIKIAHPDPRTHRIAILGVVPAFMTDQRGFLVQLNDSSAVKPTKLSDEPSRDGPGSLNRSTVVIVVAQDKIDGLAETLGKSFTRLCQ